MPSLIDIRRRIRSVKNTEQITKAMKMVASARLRRAQERVVSSRPYSQMLDELLSNVAAAAASDEQASAHPLLARRAEQRIQLVLITADRGLAGAFNSNLIKASQRFIQDHAGQQVQLELIGRKGRDYWIKRHQGISGEITGISQTPSWQNALALAAKISKRFAEAETDSVYLLYNEFKSVLSQKVVLKQILPIAIDAAKAPIDYIFEQPPVQLLNGLLPRYAQLEVLKAFLETAAAEHAARMTAMDAATTNANDVIESLTLYMNRVRQASITREIIEVVSGAAALE
jgi:F-type H+-transporting ATPase subunit gamma